MGTGFKGGASHYHSITENLTALQFAYPYHGGYFGKPGKSSVRIRNISCDNPDKAAQDFYKIASYGGIEHKMNNNHGEYSKMADGTVISYRKTSTSDGSPAIDININHSTGPGEIRYQKIHFVKGG